MKRKETPNRTRKITIRLLPSEYEQLTERFKATTSRRLSQYLRRMLLGKPVQVRYRNQSADEFLSVALQLKRELSTIGNNYNQVLKKLQLYREIKELKSWIAEQERIQQQFLEKTNQINEAMDKVYQQWFITPPECAIQGSYRSFFYLIIKPMKFDQTNELRRFERLL